MKKFFWSSIYLVASLTIIMVFTDGWKDIPVFEFMKSSEERLACGEEIKNIPSGTNDSKRYNVINIKSNTVEYPLNKDDIMIEYCITVANFSSEVGGLWVTVKLLDKNKNVLAEDDELVADIPGMRTKTTYGAIFVPTHLGKEITQVLVVGK